MSQPTMPDSYGDIHSAIVHLLEEARHAAARSVNALMSASYWEIGLAHRRSRARRAGAGGVWQGPVEAAFHRFNDTLWAWVFRTESGTNARFLSLLANRANFADGVCEIG